MPTPMVATSHPSAASDLARLAVPLVIVTASIIAALWIDHGAVAIHGDDAGASSAAAQEASP